MSSAVVGGSPIFVWEKQVYDTLQTLILRRSGGSWLKEHGSASFLGMFQGSLAGVGGQPRYLYRAFSTNKNELSKELLHIQTHTGAGANINQQVAFSPSSKYQSIESAGLTDIDGLEAIIYTLSNAGDNNGLYYVHMSDVSSTELIATHDGSAVPMKIKVASLSNVPHAVYIHNGVLQHAERVGDNNWTLRTVLDNASLVDDNQSLDLAVVKGTLTLSFTVKRQSSGQEALGFVSQYNATTGSWATVAKHISSNRASRGHATALLSGSSNVVPFYRTETKISVGGVGFLKQTDGVDCISGNNTINLAGDFAAVEENGTVWVLFTHSKSRAASNADRRELATLVKLNGASSDLLE